MNWAVDYWLGSLPLQRITSDEYNWKDIPCDGIIFVHIYYDDGKPRSMRMVGADYYFIDEDTFGCWTDPNQLYAIADRVGSIMSISEDGSITNKVLKNVPDINSTIIKNGVLVPDDVARQLKLI